MSSPLRYLSTIRSRITAVAVTLVSIVLVVTAVALVAVQRRQLTAGLDQTLISQADDLAATVGNGVALTTALDSFATDDSFAQVVDARGAVIASTADTGQGRLARGGATAEPRTISAPVLDDDPFRVLTRTVPGQPNLSVDVWLSAGEVREAVNTLAASLAIGVPAVVALLGGLAWWLIGRTLAPIEAIRSEVETISMSDLHRRVPQATTGDEVAKLATTMNQMLARIETSVADQQRFVADASHELRSPITRIRAQLEVDDAHPELAEPEETHRFVLEEAMLLQDLIDDLLALARSDDRALPRHSTPVDLDDIVLGEVFRLRSRGSVDVDSSAVTAAQVSGDAGQLSRAVRNLIENAERHATQSVTLALGEADGFAVLSVADDGPGVPSEHHESIFERFARVDEARSSRDGGTGLGLAITRAIALRHDGTVALDTDWASGARFVLSIPSR